MIKLVDMWVIINDVLQLKYRFSEVSTYLLHVVLFDCSVLQVLGLLIFSFPVEIFCEELESKFAKETFVHLEFISY